MPHTTARAKLIRPLFLHSLAAAAVCLFGIIAFWAWGVRSTVSCQPYPVSRPRPHCHACTPQNSRTERSHQRQSPQRPPTRSVAFGNSSATRIYPPRRRIRRRARLTDHVCSAPRNPNPFCAGARHSQPNPRPNVPVLPQGLTRPYRLRHRRPIVHSERHPDQAFP